MINMSDSLYDNDYFLGSGVEVKREPVMDGASASVPIPSRRPVELAELRDFSLDFDLAMQNMQHRHYDNDSGVKMEDDDIFQVDKADLIQGPTLAELNADPETLLDDLNFDDLLLPSESDYRLHIGDTMSRPSVRIDSAWSPAWSAQSPQSSWERTPPLGQSAPPTSWVTQPVELSSTPLHTVPGLSSSAPIHLTMDQIWQRREPRKHLLSTSSIAEAGSASSLSTTGILSPELDISHDDETDEESDHYEDYSSDDSDTEPRESKGKSGSKKEKFFWQYNVQAKGPKGQRLVLKTEQEDPHVLNSATDPVFSPNCSVRGIKHSGKARKGDGNDLTPNPKKLYVIGNELEKLSNVINDMTPVSELPFNARPKTRKEKNKLASRACRLKKKAQHEANKLKLHGLEQEHKRLINGLKQMKRVMHNRLTESQPREWKSTVREIATKAKGRRNIELEIAGRTSEFVNKILDKVKEGKSDGGLTNLVQTAAHQQ